jgi:hypothetical protein
MPSSEQYRSSIRKSPVGVTYVCLAIVQTLPRTSSCVSGYEYPSGVSEAGLCDHCHAALVLSFQTELKICHVRLDPLPCASEFMGRHFIATNISQFSIT